MTTSPVPSITEELLSELELHARQAVCDAITDGFPYDPRIGLTTIEENFCVAANPATILALVEHIRSLSERLDLAEKDAELFRHLMFNHVERAGNGSVLLKFGPYPEQQLRKTLSAAIDAAIAKEGQSHE